MVKKIGVFVLLILGTLGLTSCSRYISSSVQAAQTGFLMLDHQTSLGQTFTARFTGLSGVGLVINPGTESTSSDDSKIILHLRNNPQADQDLRTVSLPLQNIAAAGNYRFFFPPLPDSNQQDYYLLLEMSGDSAVQVGVAGNETYLDGGVYQNGEAQDGQLTFNLKYDSFDLVTGLLKEMLTWLVWLLTGLFLFVLPGWGILGTLWSGWRELDFLEKFSLGSGISLAIYPVLFLWTNLVGLHLGPLYAWLPPLFGLVLLLWRYPQRILSRVFRNKPASGSSSELGIINPPLAPRFVPDATFEEIASKVAFVILSGAVIFTRFWVIRSLDFPLWGDSYQHTMIAQLLIDNRGLFQSWLPYAELSTFTYHFGFHTLVACFYWISGLPIEKTILWVGQIVNLLAIICLYPLVKKLGRNLWSGVLLLLIAGLISPMPMFYLNWGRYTQLAGQAILPAAVFFIWLLLESDKLDHRVLVTSWMILGGLALTHYRILIFLIFFPIAFILLNLRAQPFKRLIPKTCLIGLGGAILFLPWLISIAPHNMLQGFITSLAASHSQATTSSTYYNVMESLLKYFPAGIWICSLVSIGWFLWRKKKNYITILLWWFLVIIAANPNLIGFPGTVGIDNFAVQIGYYIPIGIILSAAIASAVAALQIRLRQLDHLSPKLNTILLITSLVLLLIVIFYSSLSQVPQRIDDIAPTQYALATRPDQRAAGWIKKNTNLDDRFLVNSFFAFGGAWVVGSDGGWWLPLLTKRQSTQPPLNYANEEGFLPNNVARVNQIPRAILLKGLTDPTVMNLLRKRGVTYLCIGQQQGRVNSTQPLLDLAVIQGDPHFQLVYRQDQVWIYRIIY